MFCRNCGSQIADVASICVNCGTQRGMGDRFCPNCGASTAPGAQYCPSCGLALDQARPKSGKSKIAAGLLAIFLGQFGIHNFYLGYTNRAVTQLLVSILLSWTFVAPLGIWIWAIVEAVKIFQGEIPDADGRPLSD